jgi:hypothetical protein
VSRPWAVVVALLVLAAALRLVTAGDSLVGDEVFSAFVVGHRSPAEILDLLQAPQVGSPESSPPLYFLLARLFVVPLGLDAGMRAPSLIAGLLTLPLVFVMGRRAFSERAGLLAAAAWALAPFTIFYALEARPYGLLMLLAAASTLAVAVAAERGGLWRWALWSALAAAVVLTHYTGATLVAVQAVWGLLRAPRSAVLATAGAAALVLPWVIAAYDSLGAVKDTLEVYRVLAPHSPRGYVANVLHAFPAHPFVELAKLPGQVALALAALALLIAAFVAVRAAPRPTWSWLGTEQALIVGCALAAPAGLLLGGAVLGSTVFLPRSLSASLPAALVALGGLLSVSRLSLVAAAVVFAVLAVGSAQSLDRDARRPDFKGLARWVDREARPGEPVIVLSLASPDQAASRFLTRYLERPHPEGFLGYGDRPLWRRAAAEHRRVFLVTPLGVLLKQLKIPAPFRLVGRHHAPGWVRTEALVFAR